MPPSEHELRLRERLGRLKNLRLPGGARLDGELERLQRQIDKIGEEATDVVERVRPVRVAGQLDGAPDLLVARLGDNPIELPLQALELAGEPRAAEQRHVAQAAQPLAQPQLVLTRGH